MSEMRTEGLGNVPQQPVMVFPNRLDLNTLQELEKALGGAGRVAWLVEDSLRPTAEVMNYLAKTRAAGILCSIDRQSREMIAEQVHDKLAQGRHVVLLPGPTLCLPASVSAVPGRLLSFFDDTTLPALPVYVGGQNDAPAQALANPEAAAVTELRVLPLQRAGAGLGTRVLAAWMEAGADAFAKHPQLQQNTLPALLLNALADHPNARLIDGVDDSTLTYRELLALAMMFVKVLKKHTHHRRIGVLLPPGKSCAIANVACQLCGIVPVNFNYGLKEQEFRDQVAAAGVTRFITEERFVLKQNRFSWPRSRDLLFVDRELTALGANRLRFNCHMQRFLSRSRLAKKAQLAAPAPDDEALLLFTAGAGGRPEAVSLTHRMLLANVLQLQSRLATEPAETVLCSLPLFSAHSYVFCLLLPLLYGHDMVTYPTPDSGKRLCALMRQYAIRLVCTTPRCLRQMLEPAEEGTFSTVRLCITAGEKLPTDLAKDAQQRYKLAVCDGYALTETTGLLALNLPTPPATELTAMPGGKAGAVGAVLCGTAIRLTDPYRTEQALPPSTPGLLWVRGAAVMKEYPNNGALSAERRHGAWFCTGDIARMDADGVLTIGGRKNRFSRINGDMVPHDTLEMVLGKVLKLTAEAMLQHPICVVSLPDRTGGERLYLLSTVHVTTHPSELLTMRYGIMNEGYPAAWTPEQILPVKRLPLLPDGQRDIPACYELAKAVLSKMK